MNQHFPIRNPKSAIPNSGAFTLIEMLVVITIIGILAGLVVGTVSIANSKRARALAESQREALIVAIESYHKAKGFYPPDNTNDVTCVQNPLFYELTGTVPTFVGGAVKTYYSPVSGETLPWTTLGTLFNVTGFINTSNSSDSPAVNFYPGLKFNQHESFTVPGDSIHTYTLLGCPVNGPLRLNPAANTGGNYPLNPWHYNASHPTNNADSYDLWMDVSYSGKTNRICNWSREPILVNY